MSGTIGWNIIGYILLLGYGAAVLRWLVPRAYKRFGGLPKAVAGLQASLFFIYGGFPYLYLPPDWPRTAISGWAALLGRLLIFGGLGFLGVGMFQLGVQRSLGLAAGHLNKYGLYTHTRNPQALACGGYVVGFVLLWPAWEAVVWGLLYPVLIHWMVLAEEAHLREQFGQSYGAYCARVPRYWPVGGREST